MAISGIYKIQSISQPSKCYIGSAVNVNNRRLIHFWHLKQNKHHNKKLQNHYNKYGKKDLQFSILIECEKEHLLEYEQFFIDSYNPYFNFCRIAGNSLGCTWKQSNIARQNVSRGHTGLKQTEETQEKKRLKLKGRKPSELCMQRAKEASKGRIVTEGTREKLRKAMIGNIYGKGQKHTEEFKKRISLLNLGKKLSDETKAKMRISALHMTDEHKKKNSLANKGRKFTEEHKQHIKENHYNCKGENNPRHKNYKKAS